MRIGILVPSIGAFGQKGFYNAQEIGLAKALAGLCEEVLVYRLVDLHCDAVAEPIEGCANARYHLLPSRRIGNNGFPDMEKIDKDIDLMVFFSDTQLAVPQVHRWAEKHRIPLIPYLGVLKSHSDNRLKKIVIDVLFQRNLAVYKKHHCIAKTPEVARNMRELGVSRVTVAPVGLDLGLLNKQYADADIAALKQKYGCCAQDRVILFVGRMIEEKQPLRMVELFRKLHGEDSACRLLMVGTGELKAAVAARVEEYGLSHRVQMIDRIPNKDIWELYRIADCFVNLNQQEIFGMAILEAMYYGCKVAAWKAPGPSFIIEDGISGCLADSDEDILEAIAEKSISSDTARRRILDHFTWEITAKKILEIAENR